MRKSILLIFFLSGLLYARAESEDSLCIFFWNVENLFHPDDDSISSDEEFTPGGDRFWTWYRYYSKTARIWKTIIAAGNPRPPAVICLAEIENRQVLKDLFLYSPPGKYGYEIIHQDSEDRRGIDVAILYDPDRIKLISHRFIKVDLSILGGGPTRDILYAGFEWKKDSFCLFLNHWPSKYGGAGISEKFRMKASEVLVSELQNLYFENENIRAVCLGDFNDTRESSSIKNLVTKGNLHLFSLSEGSVSGSLKYQDTWQFVDHVLVTRNLIYPSQGLRTRNCRIFAPGFLLEPDLKYGGKKPFRTWFGYSYREGFSDHLPLMLTLSF